MHPFLYLALENTCSRWLIEPGGFKNMCCIYPVVAPAAHNTVAVDLKFVYRDLFNKVRNMVLQEKGG